MALFWSKKWSTIWTYFSSKWSKKWKMKHHWKFSNGLYYNVTLVFTNVLKCGRTDDYSAGDALGGGEASRFQHRRPLNRSHQYYSYFEVWKLEIGWYMLNLQLYFIPNKKNTKVMEKIGERKHGGFVKMSV